MIDFLDVDRSCTTLLRNLGIFFLMNVFLIQAFGDEPTIQPETDRDKISDSTNLFDDSKSVEFYIGLKSDQSSNIGVGDKSKKVKEQGPQRDETVVFESANLPIIGSTLTKSHRQKSRKQSR